MISKPRFLKRCRLYCILDTEVRGYRALIEIAEKIVDSGPMIFQLRDKKGSDADVTKFSQEILKITKNKALYIVNDRANVAKDVGADGVHIGQDDMSCRQARNILGSEAVIGLSCQTRKQAQEAQEQGVDYIGFGSIFKTLTKPDRKPQDLQVLKDMVDKLQIPLFGIGGITLDNCSSVFEAGIHRIAVCRAILQAEDVVETVNNLILRVSFSGRTSASQADNDGSIPFTRSSIYELH